MSSLFSVYFSLFAFTGFSLSHILLISSVEHQICYGCHVMTWRFQESHQWQLCCKLIKILVCFYSFLRLWVVVLISCSVHLTRLERDKLPQSESGLVHDTFSLLCSFCRRISRNCWMRKMWLNFPLTASQSLVSCVLLSMDIVFISHIYVGSLSIWIWHVLSAVCTLLATEHVQHFVLFLCLWLVNRNYNFFPSTVCYDLQGIFECFHFQR